MSNSCTLTAIEIQQIGETIYGSAWQSPMAKAIGVPRQAALLDLLKRFDVR